MYIYNIIFIILYAPLLFKKEKKIKKKRYKIRKNWNKNLRVLSVLWCHSPNSEPCPSSIWSFWHKNFVFICIKTLLVFWSLIIDLFPSKTPWLFPSNSMVICICFHHLFIPLSNFTKLLRLLYRVFSYLI